MNGIKLPLAFSVIGHAIGVALLVFFMSKAPLVPEPITKGGIEIVFAPPPQPEPAPPAPPAVAPKPPPPPVETQPPPEQAPPPPPVIATEPPAPAPEAPVRTHEPSPPPRRKLAVRKPPRPVPRRQEMPQPTQAYIPPMPVQPVAPPAPQAAPAPIAPPQTAMAPTSVPAPAPAASPQAVAGYRARLSAWLESHKRYPQSARERGEEGHAVLRFVVDRSGRVLDYAVTSSSGYPDLDQSVEEMMRGATLPPFPAGMAQPRMEVSVTIRFSLRH